jgi:hypothetical protein
MSLRLSLLSIATLFICFFPVRALTQPRHPITWEANPKLHSVPDSFRKAPAVFILAERHIEMQSGTADFEQYYTVHHIIRLNDDKGAEAFNTFNIPVIPGTKLYDIKARTILPSGKVIVVAKEKLKKIKSESGLPEYLLAMEGVEPGAEVEVLYTQLLPGTASGSELFQYKVPIQKASFRLIVPDHMKFEAKGYNGFPTPKDSIMEDQRSYAAVAYGIPSLEEEESSRYHASLKRIDYKLSYVLRTGKDNERRQTWAEMASQLHERYIDLGSKELRVATSLLRTIGVNDVDDEITKLTTIEEYFKTNIDISNSLTDERAAEFDQIVRKKLTTEKGFVRLFAATLKAAGIRYEIGMVGNRFEYEFDDSLEMWSHLDDYCFYLPKQDKYLAPTAIAYRYPFLPYQMCGSKGVFTRSVGPMQGPKGVGKDIRIIPHQPMMQSGVGLTASIHFDPKDLQPLVTTSMIFNGYSAGLYRPAMLFTPKDKEEELVREMIGLSSKPSDLRDYRVENTAFNSYTLGKPLIISGTTLAPKLMEKAGPKYIFKVGELIGQQAEMYEETDRKLPVEIDYPNIQPRTLRITIPLGYKVVNPEALRTAASYSDNGKPICSFTSDYKMEGTDLVVTIKEFYEHTSYPLSQYQGYRKVVNAAADFNKIVLVMQKI